MSLWADVRRQRLESAAFIGLVLIATAGFAWMVRSFLTPVFWAAVFAVLFQRTYVRVLSDCGGRRNLAAIMTTLAVVMFVVLPIALVLAAIARQALHLYESIASGRVSVHAPIDFIDRSLPAVTEFLARWGVNIDQLRVSMQEVAAGVTRTIATRAISVGQDALWMALLFGLMLYLLFFFFRDGERIVAAVARVLPLGDERRRELLHKFSEVVRATVMGTLVIAAVQGALGVLLFWIVGIETAVFWGVMMAVLSLLPAVGAGLVWLPAAIMLFVNGQT